MNELVGGIEKCFYCDGEIVAIGMCARCLEPIYDDNEPEPDPYGHGEDYWPEFRD